MLRAETAPAAGACDVLLDISELLRHPMRTGIQRVERELIRHWPAAPRLVLARFEPGIGLRAVPARVKPILLETDPRASRAGVDELTRMVAEAAAAKGKPARLPAEAPILVPELCFTAARWAWYDAMCRRAPNRVSMLVFDFIPMRRTDLFAGGVPLGAAAYFGMLKHVNRLGFISAATRDEAAGLLARPANDPGPIFAPGANGLGLEKQQFDDRRSAYVVTGSVCRNKCHDLILAAFRQLWGEGFEGELVFAGRDADGELADVLAAGAGLPRFRHIAQPTDGTLRDILRHARATIAVSHVEGYGLAPLESLAAGIPVIVSGSTPSIRDLPGSGQIRIENPSVENIVSAVRRIADCETARRLWGETALLRLPTWAEFAARIADWMRIPRPVSRWRRMVAALRPTGS
jgi:glycosyltransferase involved in cell wall biosynthesis